MSDWHESEAKAECIDLRVRVRELEATTASFAAVDAVRREENAELEAKLEALEGAARKAKALLDHATYHDGRYDQHTSPEWQKDACNTSSAIAALIKEKSDVL